VLQLEPAADEGRPSTCKVVVERLLDRLVLPTCSCVCGHARCAAL